MRFPDPDLPDDPELEEELDEEFPLGDGTADMESIVGCPYCGELVTIVLDPGGGSVQDYVEDCPVCCRPWHLTVAYDDEGMASVIVRSADG